MRLAWIILTFLLGSCSEPPSAFEQKSHDVLKRDLVMNYQHHGNSFQALASELASLKQVSSIRFKYGHLGTEGIAFWFNSTGSDAVDRTLVVPSLNDSRLPRTLQQEGLTVTYIKSLQSRLASLHCCGFYRLETININTGTPYIHIELQYDGWNGANFYCYKLFDKKMEPDMVDFFDRQHVKMGSLSGTGGVLDSNAVWYIRLD